MSVIGVDPGLSGALALYDPVNNTLDITDMPTNTFVVGKGKRERVDQAVLLEYFELAKVLGVELVAIEQVAGRPGQSGMFAFGFSVGLIHMACTAARLPLTTPTPGKWKKVMGVAGKTADNAGLIMQRANETFPDHRNKFYGPQGGKRVDRAEAALIAMYATMGRKDNAVDFP